MYKVLTRDAAAKLRNDTVVKLNALKAKVDSLATMLEDAETKKKSLNVSSIRLRDAIKRNKLEIEKTKKSLNRVDKLLAKSTVRSKGDTLVLQD